MRRQNCLCSKRIQIKERNKQTLMLVTRRPREDLYPTKGFSARIFHRGSSILVSSAVAQRITGIQTGYLIVQRECFTNQPKQPDAMLCTVMVGGCKKKEKRERHGGTQPSESPATRYHSLRNASNAIIEPPCQKKAGW